MRENNLKKNMCIYIYIHTHIYIYIKEYTYKNTGEVGGGEVAETEFEDGTNLSTM